MTIEKGNRPVLDRASRFEPPFEGFLRSFFDVSTALNLNRAYKSYWFRTLMTLLAIASSDTERYLPTMSTDFLVRIGELVTEALTARGA